ncbi:hypothetical protein [Rhodovulum euryhalinum]|uniref:Uncharacterized protein n=1 Tax=Rhodovulum euryhalinum TaxID=35805 RepID=A0A4R2KBD9_9RHOB|nr:hypothetical protein [Rhodovulum euryhalinum]TCO70783.1 hypothetical protein EV655_10824 [Rhodovulum euryhalinum]
MTTVLLLLAALSSPNPAAVAPPCPGTVHKVAGRETFCCTTVTGQQCCSPRLDDKGQPEGCDCRPH